MFTAAAVTKFVTELFTSKHCLISMATEQKTNKTPDDKNLHLRPHVRRMTQADSKDNLRH